MKLPKHNSEPFHEKAMKLKFILPFYFVLASITFCSRKISDNRDTSLNIKTEIPTAVTTPGIISGTVELDTATNTVYADLWLQVSSTDFMYAHDFMPIQSDDSYKGIAFRYYDTLNNAPDNGKDTTQIHVVFNFINEHDWKVDDEIRIMSLDEDEQSTFEDLKPYFVKRMDYFGNNPCSYDELLAFNTEWNLENPKNSVTTSTDIPSENPGEDPGQKRGQKRQTKSIPRLTKDDGILSLKLKR